MSQWRVVVKAIYERGPMTSVTLELHLGGAFDCSAALSYAKYLGVVQSPGRHHGDEPWALTQLGIDYCEGRVRPIEYRPGGRRFVATWLMSLPRGIRL